MDLKPYANLKVILEGNLKVKTNMLFQGNPKVRVRTWTFRLP